MSTLKQRQQVQAEIGVARDLIDHVELALVGEYDTRRCREVLIYSRSALQRARDSIGVALMEIGEAGNILDAEEERAATVDRPAAGRVVPAKQKG